MTMGLRAATLFMPPFARLVDVLSCASKEAELFPQYVGQREKVEGESLIVF